MGCDHMTLSDELYHYGVKGMKWGVRRTPEQLGHKKISKRVSKSKLHEFDRPIRKMINGLSKKERDHIGDGYWVDSNRVNYRRIIGDKNKVDGFLDVYNLPKFKNQGLIILATSKDIRGQGAGKRMGEALVQDFRNGLLGDDTKNLRWLVDKDNIVSENLAKSLGFQFISETDTEKEYKLFK